jgi:hypothetical protein
VSYDLRVWCVKRPDAAHTGTVARGKGWLVNAAAGSCLSEDIPDLVGGQLPGIEHVVDLSLEPIDAPHAGKTAIWKVARTIAKSSRGVIEDPQEDVVELPSGVKRFTPIKHEADKRVSVVRMSWWFDHGRLFDKGAITAFLDTLERFLPEAMPRRYGLYEPPQHEYSRTRRDHFIQFLVANLTDTTVWYAHRPVLHVFKNITRDPGWIMFGERQTYRCNCIALEIDATAVDQPGWEEGLRRAWRNISRELCPFFGDVRTLHGHIARGRSFWSDGQTEVHPVRSWFWRGVPPRLGHAAVIGEPYLSLWTELRERATPVQDGGLAFISTPDWCDTTQDAADQISGVPERFAIRAGQQMRTLADLAGGGASDESFDAYPAVFPFARQPT